MVLFLASLLLLGTGTSSAPHKAKAVEIAGKPVTQAEFDAKKRALVGSFGYHCKKTTFGGVVSYKAHDAQGQWFEVTVVSGGKQPSNIAPTDAPAPKRYRVYKADQLVLELTDAPGPLVSTSAPPPLPGSKPATHPFLSATARVPQEEGKLRALLDASHSTAEYLAKLREAGYRVEEAR